jgi:hypothetical protein
MCNLQEINVKQKVCKVVNNDARWMDLLVYKALNGTILQEQMVAEKSRGT